MGKRLVLQLTVPVVGILRGVDPVFFAELMEASFAAGLQALEVTMNTRDAESMIAAGRTQLQPGKLLGMGTVRNLAEAERAVGAGAMFLVTPNLDRRVIEFATAQSIPVVAGALTPTEVYKAWSAGAAMVKVFPCGSLGGSRYIRELAGPFDQVPLLPVGGVTLDNVRDYFVSGAAAVGAGGALFGNDALRKMDVEKAVWNLKRFLAACPPSQDTVY